MFPLGSVLFPYMPLPLRVFEERYLTMLARILPEEPSEFGVVLIERGQEVGGGEQRFSIGTVAQIEGIDTADGYVVLVARGERRIQVIEWMPENPYPEADVRVLPELKWDDGLAPLLERAELVVRRAISVATEYAELPWSPDVEISDDPIESAWQLAAIAPLNELDQIKLLRSTNMAQLLVQLDELATAATETFRNPWAEG
jgi:hypothetical protein